jgi:hypothetical protein
LVIANNPVNCSVLPVGAFNANQSVGRVQLEVVVIMLGIKALTPQVPLPFITAIFFIFIKKFIYKKNIKGEEINLPQINVLKVNY